MTHYRCPHCTGQLQDRGPVVVDGRDAVEHHCPACNGSLFVRTGGGARTPLRAVEVPRLQGEAEGAAAAVGESRGSFGPFFDAAAAQQAFALGSTPAQRPPSDNDKQQ
jgi:hypothetical protein